MNLRYLGQPQLDDDTGYTTGWDPDTIRTTGKPPEPDYAADAPDGKYRFGSSHPGRFDAALADGSVRPVACAIDPTTFRHTGDTSGGQPINDNDF
jgi:hypothetical protein